MSRLPLTASRPLYSEHRSAPCALRSVLDVQDVQRAVRVVVQTADCRHSTNVRRITASLPTFGTYGAYIPTPPCCQRQSGQLSLLEPSRFPIVGYGQDRKG